MASQSLHATGIVLNARGLIITGPSGAGKSRTAAQLLALGAKLVSDDLLVIERRDAMLRMKPPQTRTPQLALRGFGVLDVPLDNTSPRVHGQITLTPDADISPLPEPATTTYFDLTIPHLTLRFAEDLGAQLMLWLNALNTDSTPSQPQQ